jgi:hypothetical protein
MGVSCDNACREIIYKNWKVGGMGGRRQREKWMGGGRSVYRMDEWEWH